MAEVQEKRSTNEQGDRKSVLLRIDEPLHRALKIEAARRRESMTGLVTALIRDELGREARSA